MLAPSAHDSAGPICSSAGYYVRLTIKLPDMRMKRLLETPLCYDAVKGCISLFSFSVFLPFLSTGEKKEQIMGFTVRFNAYVSDDWTSFRCSRQGNLQIQSRYVLWILKKTKPTATVFPEVFSGSCAGLEIGSHVHLQSMDSITASCNIMQSNAAQSIATENYHIFMAW